MSKVFTIGYEGTNIEKFIEALKAAGILQLADVRAVALSRKEGFSKKSLSARLAEEGIKYLHFVSLGDPKPGRDAARSGNFDLFRSIYSIHIKTDDAQNSLRNLINAVKATPTCLLCFERNPNECHRMIVAREVANETGFDISHLFADRFDRRGRRVEDAPRLALW